MNVQTFGTVAPRLAELGYDPLPIIPGQKRPRPAQWQHGGFAAHAALYNDDFTGILTRETPAVDIDVSDAELVRQIEGIVLDVLDCHALPPPARIGMAPRRLMMFRTDEPFGKLQTAEYSLPSDPVIDGKTKHSKVEILADGQQFVAIAIHPNTGQPYAWNGGGDPLTIAHDDLLTLDWHQAVDIIARADKLLAEHGKRINSPRITQHAGERKANADLRADDLDLLRQALATIPNDESHFDEWLGVLYAMKGAAGDEGLNDFLEWSARSAKHDEAFARKEWRKAQPRYRGAGSIFWLAEAQGWKRPKTNFIFGAAPELREIKADLPAVPAFDGQVLLPKILRDFVLDEADRMPCSPDYVAAALIVALGSVIGARVALKPKRRDDWIVTPNVFGGVVGDPSSKKTPAVATVMRFIDRLEAKQAAVLKDKMKVFEGEKLAHAAHQAAIAAQMKKAAASKDDAPAMASAVADMAALQSPEEPTVRRFRTSDATVPKLGDMLAKNPAGMLVFRDELVGLLASWDREGNEGDRTFYLEGWNGTGSYSIDRIGRGSQLIPNLCLSVFGGVQPDLLEKYLGGIVNSMDNDGRIQRFQVLVFPDATPWEWRDRYSVKGAREGIRATFDRLAEFDPLQDGAAPADDFVKLPHFRFDDKAQETFIEWSQVLYSTKIAAETNPLMRQHLAKYEKLFCALALILHLAEGVVAHEVGVDAALRAAAWCDYLEAHARRVYALVEVGQVNTARMLGRRLAERKLADGFTARDVVRKGWAGLASSVHAEAALAVLEEHAWVVGGESSEATGRPTTRYTINPAVYAKGRKP